MNKNKKNFCIAPFINLHHSGNKKGPCCRIVNWTYDNSKSQDENFNTFEFQELRKKFLSGEKPEECKLCWNDEKGGKTSFRQYINVGRWYDHDLLDDKLKNSVLTEKSFDYFSKINTSNLKPKSLAIYPGNECNLACRMCGGDLSSKWNAETKRHGETVLIKQHQNWRFDASTFKKIIDASDSLTRLEIYGGEPLYNKSVKEKLLEKLITKGTAKNIAVYFNTNATTVQKQWFEKLNKHFKSIQISCSIDGIDEHNDYIRFGSNFSKIIENINFFNRLDNVVFGGVICTLSLYNFYYTDRYAKYFDNEGIRHMFHFVHNPKYLNAVHLPDEIKQNIELPSFVKKFINSQESNPEKWKLFVQYTNYLDKIRNQSFADTFPEFWEICKNHWS